MKRGSRLTVVFVFVFVLVFAGGCDKKENWAEQPKPPSKQEDLARITAARKGACSDEVAVQAAAPAHVELVDAITNAKEHGFEADLGPLKEVPNISTSIENVQKDIASTAMPDRPDKPSYEKPKYNGAWPISGLCRGRYNEDQGIVIQANGKYYVVKGADPCETPYVNGFVEDSGETVTLDLGRDGREAVVVLLRDRETYLDDQKTYRDQVTQAQADYQTAVKEYPAQLRQWQADVAAAANKKSNAIVARDNLVQRWQTVLACSGTPAVTAGRSGRHDGVDPDCYGEGRICSKARVADAEALDQLIGGTMIKAGWPLGCYELRYIDGDSGGKDAISVSVTGGCKSGVASASKPQLTQLATTLKKLIANKAVAKNVDTIQVTDGNDIDVQLRLTVQALVTGKSAVNTSNGGSEPVAVQTSESVQPRGDDVSTVSGNGKRSPCDEVSCSVNSFKDDCCTKFKKATVEPAADETPTEPSKVDLKSSLDRSMISAGISGVKARVSACGDGSSAKGLVKVRVRVDGSGSVSDASISQTPDAALGECVVAAMKTATFATTANGGAFSYPFVF